MPLPPEAPASASSGLSAPLYVAWQLTNECNLACLHCIEESGPGKAFKDELSDEHAFAVLRQIVSAQVPYLCFSGGEPLAHPNFWELAEHAVSNGIGLKIESNGHLLDREACRRLAAIGVQAVQVSLDGAGPESYGRLRVRGRWESALAGILNLREACVPVEINFSPTRFNAHEIASAVDLACELGAVGFYTGRILRAGNAQKSWDLLAPSEQQYAAYFNILREKTEQHKGRMRVCFHEMGLTEELKYRLKSPAALFIILPNGKVKLINALPFVCGDLRTQTFPEVWRAFQSGWTRPEVARFVADLEKDPALISRIHQWVELN
ncbi:MAG: radical SAM protein [Elusimicrobiota bacterium]|jgi:MoaA/NifB/PqqE/SkfB family radical SAM enzyme